MIADVLNVYGSEVGAHRKSAKNIGYVIGSLLKWWGDKTAADISTKTCREYAATRSSQAASADIKYLRAATIHWHKEHGPLNFVPTFWRPEANPPRDRWLTRNEAARLLWAARRYLHLRRMILLGLYTGSRPGVILALQWSQVNLRDEILSRVPSNVAQDRRKRAPKVRLGRRILSHLRRWHRIDGGKGYVCHFQGNKVAEPHTAWAKVVKAAKLEGVTPHVLRHTRATWMAQKGVALFQAAGFLGMSVKTLERVYAHHDPSWQDDAANI